jgi:hypothetical protein
MSPTDLARLELAKRAHAAAQPSAVEVQCGVRRARLRLGQRKPRRSWLGKGLVLVVLALGSMAYAKPQAMGELLRRALQPSATSSTAKSATGHSARAGAPQAKRALEAGPRSEPIKVEPVLEAQPVLEVEPVLTPPRSAALDRPTRSAALDKPTRSAALDEPARALRSGTAPARVAERRRTAVSEWGRVGSALAQGDETTALTALEQLSKSSEAGTRDKADLGRAQLLMARGDRARACALGRALGERATSPGVERQARALLKSCAEP